MERFVIMKQLIINAKPENARPEIAYSYLKSVKGICLDMDGTIADSMGVLFRAYMDFLSKFNVIGTRKQFESISHLAIPDVVEFLHQKYYLDSSLIYLNEVYIAEIRESYALGIPLMPGARVFIEFVKKKGLKLALVTSAREQIAKQFLMGHELLSLFDAVVTPSYSLRGKPFPDIYTEALHCLGIQANEAIAVEDAEVGLSASTQAGIASWKYSETTDWEVLMKLVEEINANNSMA